MLRMWLIEKTGFYVEQGLRRVYSFSRTWHEQLSLSTMHISCQDLRTCVHGHITEGLTVSCEQTGAE